MLGLREGNQVSEGLECEGNLKGGLKLNWHAQAHLKVCACSTGSVHMLNWKHADA